MCYLDKNLFYTRNSNSVVELEVAKFELVSSTLRYINVSHQQTHGICAVQPSRFNLLVY